MLERVYKLYVVVGNVLNVSHVYSLQVGYEW